MTSVATLPRQNMAVAPMPEQQLVAVLKNSLYPGAADDSVLLVLDYCRATGLDPMQKPVHIVPMWDKASGRMRDVIMPGVGLYRTQAARTGQLAGIDEPEFGPDINEEVGGLPMTYPAWCRVTVKRRLPTGEIVGFTALERWKENYAVKGGKEKSVAPNAMWEKRPYGQIAKCAQAQALRMAFPEMVGSGATADEMEGKALDIEGAVIDNANGTVQQPARPEKQPYPAESFAKNLPEWAKLIASGKKTHRQIVANLESKATLSREQHAQIMELPESMPEEAPEQQEGAHEDA